MTSAGKSVLITRPREQAQSLQILFEQAGFRVFFQPTIEILPPEDWREQDGQIACLSEFDWLLFSSRNGVTGFADRYQKLTGNLSNPLLPTTFPSDVKIAAVGAATADALEERGFTVSLIPEVANAEGMLAALESEPVEGKRFLSIRGSRGRDVLSKELTHRGGHVTEISVYRSVDITTPDPDVVSLLERGEIEVVTATSSAIGISLIRLFGPLLTKTKLVSISPLTSSAIREAGYTVAAEAETATMESIVQAALRLL